MVGHSLVSLIGDLKIHNKIEKGKNINDITED